MYILIRDSRPIVPTISHLIVKLIKNTIYIQVIFTFQRVSKLRSQLTSRDIIRDQVYTLYHIYY